MDRFSLDGKNVIVIGGSTGLGQAFALALAQGGANVRSDHSARGTRARELTKRSCNRRNESDGSDRPP